MLDIPESTPLPKDGCGGCKFYYVNRGKINEGACRRFPPAVNLLVDPPNLMVKSDFPPVKSDEWCGEFWPRGTNA